jgi:RND family efflux transporter MFP subunit
MLKRSFYKRMRWFFKSSKTCFFGINTPKSAILFAIFITVSCAAKKEPEKPKVPDSIEVRPQVLMRIVDDLPIAQYIETEGIIESAQQLNIVSRESGYVVNHQLVDGKMINKGDVLFELDSRSLQLRIAEAQIALQKVERDMNIERTMRENSGVVFNETMTKSLRLQFGVDEALIRLKDLQLSAQFMNMTAPFTGKLSIPETRNVGDFISAGTVLGMLLNSDVNRLKLFVLQQDASAIQVGQLVVSERLDTLGSVSAISPVIDAKLQSVSVWVRLKPEIRFMHGERIKTRIITQEKRGTIRVPRSAVLERDNRWVVFKNKAGQAQWVYVTPKALNREWAVVDGKGLAPGDTIAYDRHFTLSHLQKITPVVN